MTNQYKHLSLVDRQNIQAHLDNKLSYEQIARRLGRSISTISYEINKGKVNGKYDAYKADHKAYTRRKYGKKYQGMKIVKHSDLRKYVEDKIKLDWSPELISGRIKRYRKDLPSIGTDAVYKYIKSVYGRQLEKHLWYKNKRWGHNRFRVKKEKLKGRVSIEKRPKHVERRIQVGHYEGDFIVSNKNSKWVLLVLIERSTRFVLIRRLSCRNNVLVNECILEMRSKVKSFRSLTLDNDIAFTKHVDLAKGLDCPVYFCHPYHSWEKGSVENMNKLIRRSIPKGKDISLYSDKFIQELEDKLNDRPKKVLEFRTAREVMLSSKEI